MMFPASWQHPLCQGFTARPSRHWLPQMLLLSFHVGHPKPFAWGLMRLPGSGVSKQTWEQNCLFEVNSSWGNKVTCIFFITNAAEIPSFLNTSVTTRPVAVAVDGAAKTGLGVRRWGRTGIHHLPHGNQESCQCGMAAADLASGFAPWDAGQSQSFVRSWEE